MKWLNRDYKTFTKFKEEKELEVLVAEDTGYNEFLEYKDKYGNNSTIHFKKYKKYEKIKAFIDNNSFLCLFVIPMFSVSIVVIAIVAFFTQKNTDNLVKVLTYFLALITLMATIINYSTQKKLQQEISNKKLIAEIIAKSRIEWLKEMREHVSIYMSLANQASIYAEENLNTIYMRSDLDVLNKYNSLVQKAEVVYYKIIFNMNRKEPIFQKISSYSDIYNIEALHTEHCKKIKELDNVISETVENALSGIKKEQEGLTNTPKEKDENKKNTLELTNKLKQEVNHISIYRKGIQDTVGESIQAYFKKEWDKAKEEIRSGEVAPTDKQEK